MYGRKEVIIGFDVDASLEKRDGYWAAYIEPTGMTVYGDTREAVERRVNEGIDFFVEYAPDLQKYLNSHAVPHHVRYAGDEEDETPVRRTYVEGRVYA